LILLSPNFNECLDVVDKRESPPLLHLEEENSSPYISQLKKEQTP
jgi:hypothetical protein